MGARLTSQRWLRDQGSENGDMLPLSSSNDAEYHANGGKTGNGDIRTQVLDETQHLWSGRGWDHHISPEMSYQTAVAGRSIIEHGGVEEMQTSRTKVRHSIAYDTSDVSTEQEVRKRFGFRPRRGWSMASLATHMKHSVGQYISSPQALLFYLLPISRDLRSYNYEKFVRDFITGMTMGTLMIPQGLTFAAIAGTPLLYGLYISWIPLLVYSLFGVSVHVSFGPFALVGLFLKDALGRRGYKPCNGLCSSDDEGPQEYVEVCVIITFMASMWHFFFSFTRLGESVAMLLADPVVKGFVTATAILIVDAQIFNFLQVVPAEGTGSGVMETFSQVWICRESINWVSVSIATASMVLYLFLQGYNRYLRRMGVKDFFIPEALLVVIITTFFSWLLDLHGTYGVGIVGTIPAGLPHPTPPRFAKLASFEETVDMAQVALISTTIAFVFTQSIAKSLAGAVEVKATSQLFAFGAADLVGCFFFSLPSAASMSRAGMIDSLDARTMIHNVYTFVFMTFVLLFLSPLLECLPTSVLPATIYPVMYKFFDFYEPFRLYHVGLADAIMWLATFTTTLFVGVKEGMLVGVVVSALTIVQRSSAPLLSTMGRLPETHLYRDFDSYPNAERVSGVEVIRFGASLTFANKDLFRREVIQLVENPGTSNAFEKDYFLEKLPLQFLVVDSSSIHHVDASSLTMLEALVEVLLNQQPPIEILMASVSDSLALQIYKSEVLSEILGKRFFLGVAPAVQYASKRIAGGTPKAPAKMHKRP